MKLLSKKTALLAIAALVAVGSFAAPSAEAHGRGHDRGWGGWSRHDRGHHYGWRNNDRHRDGWRSDRGPRHHFRDSGWGGRRGYESRRHDWNDRRYYR